MNPRDTMGKETSIIGVSLFSSTKVGREGAVLMLLSEALGVLSSQQIDSQSRRHPTQR